MKQYKQRAVIAFTVESKDINKIQKIIDFAKGIDVAVDYRSLKMVCR